MGTIANPFSGLIDGLLTGHELGLQLRKQALEEQAFRTNQAMHEQQMSVQDIMNRQMLQEHARPVSDMGTVDNPAGPDMPGVVPGLGPQQGAYRRKADAGRTVKYGGRQYELKTPEEQQQAKLDQEISTGNALEDAKIRHQNEALQAAHRFQLQAEGGGTPAPAEFETLGVKPGTLITSAQLTAGKEQLLKMQKEGIEIRKGGLEADELQRKTDMLKNTNPKDALDLVDEITGSGNEALRLRTRARVMAAQKTGDMAGVKAAIDAAANEVGQIERATDPRVAANKIHIALSTQEGKTAAMGTTEDDFKREGEKYALTGVMPPLGMGQNGRGKIIHYANEFARENHLSPRDVATGQAAFQGDKKSLENFQKQRDQIVSFENTAGKNLDLFLNAASKIPDTGSPWLNLPLRQLNEKLVGSPAMAAVNAARQVANNEIAKVTSGGGLGGVLSDSARKEVEAFNPANATLKQTIAVARILKEDMANRHQSMDAMLGEIRNRMGNGGSAATAVDTGGASAAPAGKIRVISPEGVAGFIDADKWEAAQKRGFKRQ